jgi:hypothetical protein
VRVGLLLFLYFCSVTNTGARCWSVITATAGLCYNKQLSFALKNVVRPHVSRTEVADFERSRLLMLHHLWHWQEGQGRCSHSSASTLARQPTRGLVEESNCRSEVCLPKGAMGCDMERPHSSPLSRLLLVSNLFVRFHSGAY